MCGRFVDPYGSDDVTAPDGINVPRWVCEDPRRGAVTSSEPLRDRRHQRRNVSSGTLRRVCNTIVQVKETFSQESGRRRQ